MRTNLSIRAEKRGVARALRRLVLCTGGAAALEFAFAAPVIFVALAGALEMSMLMFVTTLMEGGLREASRFGITGHVPPGTTREQRILETIKSNTVGLIDIDTAKISYKIYPSFGDVGKPEPYTDNNPANGSYDPGEQFNDVNGNGKWDADMGVAGLGGPGDVVLYTVSVDWRMLTPLIGNLINETGILKLESSVVVRNEPFPDPVGG